MRAKPAHGKHAVTRYAVNARTAGQVVREPTHARAGCVPRYGTAMLYADLLLDCVM